MGEFYMNFNLSKKNKSFGELLYILRPMKQEVRKDANVFVVKANARKANGKSKSKDKTKPKSMAQKQFTIATQPTSNVGKWKVVCFFYGKFGH